MNGIEATKAIRKLLSKCQFSDIPIIACSAFESSENIKECLDSGMNMFIKKPVTIDKI